MGDPTTKAYWKNEADAAGGSGSRSTGQSKHCCMRRAYHGCPGNIVYDIGKAKERKADGWKKAS